MGQKIHPLGFRVGITKNYQSQWFARFHKRKYAQSVLEDRLLRESLLKLFPTLLNPALKKGPKNQGTATVSPQITHIKIERGLIPYEIGIQIHAGNCNSIKSSIDQLEVDQNLLQNLQKTRCYLLNAKAKFEESRVLSAQKGKSNKKLTKTSKFNIGSKKYNSRFGLSSNDRQVNQRRSKKYIFNFRKSLLENMLILKEGKQMTRKLQKRFYSSLAPGFFAKQKQNAFGSSMNPKKQSRRNAFSFAGQKATAQSKKQNNRFSQSKMALAKNKASRSVKNRTNTSQVVNKISYRSPFGQSASTRAFVNMFISKTSQKFVKTLKQQMNEWNRFLKDHKESQIQKYGSLMFAPLGYQRKWSLARLNRLQKQPLNILMKLLKALQKKALQKMDVLQKEFTALGTISKMESFNYYQMVRFIKSLKKLVKMLFVTQSAFLSLSGNDKPTSQQKQGKALLNLTESALKKKFNNLDDECRKVKFIDYLELLVKKHRQKNIYLYLSTISDSRKFLRKIQQFTKQQAGFLFGVDLNAISQYPVEKQRELLTNKVAKAYKEANMKNQLEKNVTDVFLEQMQKQRILNFKNIELTPKISIKFYNVKENNLKTKASLVAESIVDDLERRKAFRGVLKKAKDNLMANSRVKGVKIQLSGRLNGAEIARSEWIRAGRVPLQTLRANIDYCYKTARTIYGIIGVKVWIYKGYTKMSV